MFLLYFDNILMSNFLYKIKKHIGPNDKKWNMSKLVFETKNSNRVINGRSKAIVKITL